MSVISEQSRKRKREPCEEHERELQPPELQVANIRKCRYCGVWSNSTCPWELTGTVLSSWHPHLPWARGRFGKVTGDRCKPCQIAS